MPFDATGGYPEPARQPKRPAPSSRGAAILVVVISVLMLVTPFSLAACSDLVRYARSR